MSVSIASNCLTRVVVDDDHDIEIAQLQSVMDRIQDSLPHVPVVEREYIANALLKLAVARMLSADGTSHAVGMLARLGKVVSENCRASQPEHAVDLTRRHG